MTPDDKPAPPAHPEPLPSAEHEKPDRQAQGRHGERDHNDLSPTEPGASTEQQPT